MMRHRLLFLAACSLVFLALFVLMVPIHADDLSAIRRQLSSDDFATRIDAAEWLRTFSGRLQHARAVQKNGGFFRNDKQRAAAELESLLPEAPTAIQLMVVATKDENPIVANLGIDALGSMPVYRTHCSSLLREIARDDTYSLPLRANALYEIGGDPTLAIDDDVPLLIEFCGSCEAEVRLAAVSTLISVGIEHRDADHHIANMLYDCDDDIKLTAMTALTARATRSRAGIPVAIEWLHSWDRSMQSVAVDHLLEFVKDDAQVRQILIDETPRLVESGLYDTLERIQSRLDESVEAP